MMHVSRRLINGNQLAAKIIGETRNAIKLEHDNFAAFYKAFPQWLVPQLDIINIGFDAPSLSYIKKKIDLAESIGIRFNLHQFLQHNLSQESYHKTFKKIITASPGNFTIREFHIKQPFSCFQEIARLIEELNYKKDVSGVLLQLPLIATVREYTKRLVESINPLKDVDCITSANRTRCIEEIRPPLVPCTPSGVMKIFDEYQIELKGKKVVMVGRSSLVGLPLFHLLVNRNATVTLCHSQTRNLDELTSQADVVVSAVGKANLVTCLRQGAVSIDIGISRNEEGKLCGDIAESAKQVCSLATPVPGGVGPLTVAMLMSNTVQLWRQQMMLQRVRLGFDKMRI